MHRSAEHIERSIQTPNFLLEFWLSSVCRSLKNTRKKIMTFDRRTFDRRIQPPATSFRSATPVTYTGIRLFEIHNTFADCCHDESHHI